MKKPGNKKYLTLTTVILLLMTMPVIQALTTTQTNNSMIQKNQHTTKQAIYYNGATIKPCNKDAISMDMFTTEPPMPEIMGEDNGAPTTAELLNQEQPFSIRVSYLTYQSQFTLSLDDFTYDEATHRYTYELEESYTFVTGGVSLGILESLLVFFKLSTPYDIFYQYTIKTTPYEWDEHNHMKCEIYASPLIIPEGSYLGRIMTSEGGQEQHDDFDEFLLKQAIDNTGSPTDSMVEFNTSAGVFQRGFQLLSCDSGGCSLSVTFQYPLPPEYFPIDEIIDSIWITSGWEGSPGDRFSSLHKFTVEPENLPPETPEQPQGQQEILVGDQVAFATQTIDPNNDQIYYKWDIPPTISDWIGPYESGETSTIHRTITQRGVHSIQVKAKDIHDQQSSWSEPLQIHVIMLGDMNDDGAINGMDVDPFVIALTNPQQYQQHYGMNPHLVGDINRDGILNAMDIDPFVDLLYYYLKL